MRLRCQKSREFWQSNRQVVGCGIPIYTPTICRLLYNVPGSRSGGIRTRGLLVPNQRFCRFFRFFPLPSGVCLVFPVFSGFCRLFPCFVAYFQTGSNRTFGRFIHFYRFNHPLQLPRLQHEDITCLACWSIVGCISIFSA